MWVGRTQHGQLPTLSRWARRAPPRMGPRARAFESDEDRAATFTRPKEDGRTLVGHHGVSQLGLGGDIGRLSHLSPCPKGPDYLADRRFPHTRWGGCQRGHPLRPGPSGIFPLAHPKAPILPIPRLGLAGQRGPDREVSVDGRARHSESCNSMYRPPAFFSSSVRGSEGSPLSHPWLGPNERRWGPASCRPAAP